MDRPAIVWRSALDTNPPALLAAVAASVAVCAHGIVGHRWLMAQLSSVQMQPTRLSTRLFGEGGVSREVFGLTWHCVTVVFLASAVALYLSAFGALDSRDLLRFIAVIHAAFLGVGLLYTGGRPDKLRGPIPPIFVGGMVAAASLAWIASNSV
jgi:hypothetical protein